MLVIAPHGARAAAAGNPCALLSLAEAQSITHFELTSPVPNPLHADGGADKDTACSYSDDPKSQYVTVVLHDDAAFFPGNGKAPNTEGFMRLKGVGDRAWTNGLAMAEAVYVLKDGRYASVMVADPGGLRDRGKHSAASALAIARLVASRL